MTDIQAKYDAILGWFEQNCPDVDTELHYRNPFELLVATILAAQCTDKRVNMVTPELFKRFPNAKALSKASLDEVLELISSVSFPNNKAKHLIAMAQKLCADFDGVVPSDTEAMQTLPGVGQKTAHVLGAVIWKQPVIPVDTHVFRVAERLGLTHNSKSPEQTEAILVSHIAPELRPNTHHWLVLHGRYVCQARKPQCDVCGLTNWCDYFHAHK